MVKGGVIEPAHTKNWIGRICLILAAGAFAGCGITEEITKELPSTETPSANQVS